MGRGALLVIAVLAALVLALSLAFPERLRGAFGDGSLAALIQTAMVAVLVGAGLFGGGRDGPEDTLRRRILMGLAWVGSFLCLIALYSQRDSFTRLWSAVTGEMNPAAAMVDAEGAVTLRKSADGHFWAELVVNGRTVRAMVDTGASTFALDPDDARAIGLAPDTLTYNIPVATAAGPSRAAGVVLDSVRLGRLRADRVEALVLERGGGVSLLGMNVLERFSDVSVRGNTLRITP
jgi:aspartyl protease family protein